MGEALPSGPHKEQGRLSRFNSPVRPFQGQANLEARTSDPPSASKHLLLAHCLSSSAVTHGPGHLQGTLALAGLDPGSGQGDICSPSKARGLMDTMAPPKQP